jgi:CheY-like chemotaxis protein
VWDTGIGIAPEQMPKLFQPFVQIDSSLSREYSGSGLGLALALRLTEAHGGSMAVESTPGVGSRFSVTLPWTTPPLEAHSPAVGVESAGQPQPLRRALVVEDSATAASHLARYLRELGAEVEIHPRGHEAAARTLAVRPDVIILDILLPDFNGWEVLRQLKAEPLTQMIPVVVVSVVDDPARARTLGAAAFLLKPISRELMAQTLDQVMRRPAAPIELRIPEVPGRERPPRILIAEDNQANIDVLHDVLLSKGYDVAVARNGHEAIAYVNEQPTNVILMDIQMPGMDGLDAIRRLRDSPDTHDIPIIVLTALAMPGDRERCLAVGADAYLAKPVNLRELLALIAAQLARTTEGQASP